MNNEKFTYEQEKEHNKLPTFDTIATELLEDDTIKDFPEVDQGRIIADRFIGALVRHGDVEGSLTTYTPDEVLLGMDNLSKVGEKGLREITGSNGLRKAVTALASDERVGREFGQMKSRLATDEQGRYILTSISQIEGYILSGISDNAVEDPVSGVHTSGDAWVAPVMEQVQNVAYTDAEWMTSHRAQDLMTSDLPLVRSAGRDWEKARRSAEKVGVDVDLLKRSAEKVQQRVRASHAMGAAGMYLANSTSSR